MTAATFLFDGQQMTVREIHARVPALSDKTIRAHLAAGRNTAAAMLTYDPNAARACNGRVAARRARFNGTTPTCFTRKP